MFRKSDLYTAHEKIENVLLRLYRSDTMMLRALCLVDKVPDASQETIGLDVRNNPPTLKYNPEFINVLSERQVELVLASEGFKILFRHCTTRLRAPRVLSALASQITVDHFIVGSEFMTDELRKYFPTADQFGMERNLWFEEYFKNLKKGADEVMQKLTMMFGQPEEGDGDGGAGQGNGRSEEGHKKFNNADEALKDYFNPSGTSTKDWNENSRFDTEVERVVITNANNRRSWGTYTGNVKSEIMAAVNSKIGWKEIFRRFARSVETLNSISSRMKLNRRYGLNAPGYRRTYITEIVFAIDSSGSMNDEDLAEGFAVVNSCCRHAKVHYLLFDTKITQEETNVRKAKRNFKVTGRGGTDFQQVIDYADKMKADGIIIYTDGYAPAPSKPNYSRKVLWLMSKKEQKPPVDWGYVAHLNRFESHV